MSASAAALSTSWQVGRYTATLTVPPLSAGVVHALIEWEPDVPKRLTLKENEQYQAGLAAAIATLGMRALVIQT